jgi:hypothetical protein
LNGTDLLAIVVVDVRLDRFFKLVNANNLSDVENLLARFEGDREEIPYSPLKTKEREEEAMGLNLPWYRRPQMAQAITVIKWTLIITIPIAIAIAYVIVKAYDRHLAKKQNAKRD